MHVSNVAHGATEPLTALFFSNNVDIQHSTSFVSQVYAQTISRNNPVYRHTI